MFLSVAPPLMEFDDELVWLNQTRGEIQNAVYDRPRPSTPQISRKKHLMDSACTQPLSLKDQHSLFDDLLKYKEDIADKYGMTPDKLPQLVENNPQISTEILVRLAGNPIVEEYFKMLANMDITMHSMEVVNRLTIPGILPVEYINLFLTNCFSACAKIEEKFVQNRLVRLVCVFIQSLIRNKCINSKEVYLEIGAFCITYSQVKEAAILYRLIKYLEATQNAAEVAAK
ncbi:hypothetical protein KR018_002142, partial [Drosophila ironensis]